MIKPNGTEKVKEITILLEKGGPVEYQNVYRRVERNSIEISDEPDFMFFTYFPCEEIKRVSERK